MSLYPSLEDMKVDQMMVAQEKAMSQPTAPYPQQSYVPPQTAGDAPYGRNIISGAMYPGLSDFMGLELSEAIVAANMPEYSLVPTSPSHVALPQQNAGAVTNFGMVAPVTGNSLGLQRAQVTHGIRQLVLCKDKDHKIGLRVNSINKGVFVALVTPNSPAALAGLRFGDQILEIQGESVAGYSIDKVHGIFKKLPVNGITIAVRDRPFERTITLHKDSANRIGFQFKNGKIISIVKDSSAARNGVLIDHQLLEIDGQNVVGMKDKQITSIIEKAQMNVTITIMPTFLYDHMVNKMASSLLKSMDHSIPAV